MLRIKRLHDHVADARARLEQLSLHDELTGLYNYRYLHARLNEEFKRAERYHDPLACMVIDIDSLHGHNDAFGRAEGDRVIRRVAEALRRSVREVDVVARYGGDEFLVVLPSTHFAGAATVAERIWRELRETAPSERAPDPLSLSVGVALYPSRDVRTKDALLRAADAALHTPSARVRPDSGLPAAGPHLHAVSHGPPASARPFRAAAPRRGHSPRSNPAIAASLRSRARVTLSLRASSGEYGAVRLEDTPPRVLVVDDEPTLRRSLARLLLSRGMSVVTADDGAVAMQLLEHEPVDVALVDLMMPRGGRARVARARARRARRGRGGDDDRLRRRRDRGQGGARRRLPFPDQAVSLERRGRAHDHQGGRAQAPGRSRGDARTSGSSTSRSSAS